MDAHPFAGTKTEFRLRVLFITLVFCAAYSCYLFDHLPSGVVIGLWLHRMFGRLSEDAWVRVVFFFGATLTFLGAIIRTWGTSYLKTAVMRDYKLHTEKLVADGPFRYVRNPLYFGNILMSIGMGLTASLAGFFVLVIGMTIVVVRLILREEAELRETQGEGYLAYCRAVPRLIPSLTPRVPSGGGVPNWPDGFVGEIMTWGFGAAIVVLALTFKWTLFMILVWGSFGGQWIIFAIQKSREKKIAGG
ncbi:MAG: isoprenylcysteine carboxylmethyltransferase family protein [Candidatus Acidiferrales bacterium]